MSKLNWFPQAIQPIVCDVILDLFHNFNILTFNYKIYTINYYQSINLVSKYSTKYNLNKIEMTTSVKL